MTQSFVMYCSERNEQGFVRRWFGEKDTWSIAKLLSRQSQYKPSERDTVRQYEVYLCLWEGKSVATQWKTVV